MWSDSKIIQTEPSQHIKQIFAQQEFRFSILLAFIKWAASWENRIFA